MNRIVLCLALCACASTPVEPAQPGELTVRGVYRYLDGDNIFVGCDDIACAVHLVRTEYTRDRVVAYEGRRVWAVGVYVSPCEDPEYFGACVQSGRQPALLIRRWGLE